MKTQQNLLQKIKGYLKKGQLTKSEKFKEFTKSYSIKARKNLTTARLLINISTKDELKKSVNLSKDFESFEWVIIISYYSMYISSLALLSNLGFKSKSHLATIIFLEYHYVQCQKTLEEKEINKLKSAREFSEQLINKLIQAKARRETSQYEATPTLSLIMAEKSLEDAEEFIEKTEMILQN